MDKTDIPFLPVTGLSRLIERREVSPVEATEAYLARIDDLDFKFDSYLTVCRKEALRDAREAERAISQGGYLGPMHGIPVAVKDQFWTKGIRTTVASRILADSIPDDDATVVANLKRAGAILLGKTNLAEFAIGIDQRYSSPRNPWDLDTYAGASSGGSGAATAAFLCATSLGEDTGGSIRFPASWCGLVGLKPGWGRVSRYGINGGVWSMDTVGPLSRTVEDSAITLSAIAGRDPKDLYTWNTPVPDYRRALDGNIGGIRVGVIAEYMAGDGVGPQVGDAVLKATSALGELGASVEEVSIPLAVHAWTIFWAPFVVEPALNHRDWVRDRLRDYGAGTRVTLLTGNVLPAQAYYKAQKLRTLLRRQVHEAFEKYDVLVSPTMGKTAIPFRDVDWSLTKHFLTPIFNLSGDPAITLPCGFSQEGLPIGFQIAGRPGEEETVLKVAHAYEQSTPWHTMRPPNV